MDKKSKPGTLYLIPTSLSENEVHDFASKSIVTVLSKINYLIVENKRTARRFLAAVNLKNRIDLLNFSELDDQTNFQEMEKLIQPLLQGKDMGLLSEAGCPCIADPGAQIVELAHRQFIKVVPMVGPSSILLALIASGMNGQNFAFHGYLPIHKQSRAQRIKELERDSQKENRTQIFMEAPYRNNHLMEDILRSCGKTTRLCIAANLTGTDEFISTQTIEFWRKNKPDLNKRPAMFLLHAS